MTAKEVEFDKHPKNSEYYISLDIGTTSVKVILFDNFGKMASISTHEYSLYTPSEGIVEFEAEKYWKFCLLGIKEVLSKSGISKKDVKSIGVCSQGETLICLDKRGKVLCNAIVWMDSRSKKEAHEITKALGSGAITGQLGCEPAWPITKILWLKKNAPELYAKVDKFILVEDYIIFMLADRFVGEYSLYASSFMLDIYKKDWWDDILNYVGISRDRLVILKESGRVVGHLKSDVCDETGLTAKTVVVTGAMDQTSGAIGSGGISSDIITETTGAALAIFATIDKKPSIKRCSIPIQCHAIADKYLLINWCPTGGMAFKWFRDTFFEYEQQLANEQRKDCYDVMVQSAEHIPAGCQGLMFLPYLAGGAMIDTGYNSAGVFYGIGLHHRRGHFVRAIMESLAYILRENVEMMTRLGIHCKEIHSLGGGAKSLLWNQIKADITGKPIVTMRCSESAALGTAILQSVAVGSYGDIEEACRNMIHKEAVIEPNEEATKLYESAFSSFLSLKSKIMQK
ncbi:MAG: hypothetical protein UT30_C0029G0005 [Candidatus Uhrbacteria bacterium GW2011_GWF2_39_13]|uniref:Xylulokinase n=1 Tax=Candidatus Uhrbacteria bacterium GW2011_GWF2_39_13 TaxID=1618995 RepID=A0A0G0QP90_9BACT|nr:MAG: hypothetical protein UT30_C0029G0005 [Candidatus Uhrbacteria bacterium GW2011_GWF2_39_13]